MGCIYKITNTVNNKAYIGQTRKCDPYERWKGHLRAIKYNNGCPILTAAFKKYGVDKFKFEVIILCFDEDVCKYEKEYVQKYNTLAPNGYNAVDGGEMGGMFKGKHHTEATKKMLKEKSTTFCNNHPEVRLKNIEKIKVALKTSEKWKKAIDEGRVGRNGKGRKDSKEAIEKRRQSLIKYYTENKELLKDKYKNSLGKYGRPGNPVHQFDINNNFIKEYPSVTDAEKQTNITRRNIHQSISGNSKTAGGFVWKYADNTNK